MGKFDFEGWITKNNIRCSDGAIIQQNAFAHCDRMTVPLVYNHDHDSLENVLGHCRLENRPEGVYGYASLNNTEAGELARKLIQHGDVMGLSVYANGIRRNGANVTHGDIKEVSLVLAGANPGAKITHVDMAHGEGGYGEEVVMSFIDDEYDYIAHGDNPFDSAMDKLTEEEQNAVYSVITAGTVDALADYDDDEEDDDDWDDDSDDYEDSDDDDLDDDDEDYDDSDDDDWDDSDDDSDDYDEGEDGDMMHNIFENDNEEYGVLSHEAEGEIIGDAKRIGSLKESFIQHAAEYGVDGIEWLFPEVHNITPTPQFIKRDTNWVDDVFNGAHKTPFSRIKSVFADITEDDARAKGYIKGKYKKEEVFTLLKRTTQPTTIYKKQKMDKDDIIDLASFDAISWLKTEMRMMLNEEIARAILVGDGRNNSSDDKINESCIRPIWKDEDFYTIKAAIEIANDDTNAIKTKKIIDGIIRSRKFYKGSGNPAFFTTEDFVTDCLLLEDGIGHKLYKSVNELATTLRVSKIVTVEIMEGLQRTVDSKTHDLVGIIVNMNDYTVGADKGGAINMFEDFDIDYNQQKYLIETRCSGSLVKPFSAIAVETVPTAG